MKSRPTYERFPMLTAAWDAAVGSVDDRGSPLDEIQTITKRFLKRKACLGLEPADCEFALHQAIGIAKAVITFQRSCCGHIQPLASRRYELLHELAVHLENEFPNADPYLIILGCGLVEMHWDR